MAKAAIINPDLSALSLLSAVAFTIDMSSEGAMSFVWARPADAAQLLHCSLNRLPTSPRQLGDRLSLEAQRERKKAFAGLGWDGAQYRLEYALDIGDGRSVWLEESGQRMSGAGSSPLRVQAVLRNIDGAKTKQDAAKFSASHDPLTGLRNKSRMAEEAAQLIGLASRNLLNPAIAGFTVTNLADVNANFGYGAGDRLLELIAERLKALTHTPDTLARLSGDSFVLGICDVNREALRVQCETIVSDLTRKSYVTPDGEVRAVIGALAAVRLSADDGPENAEAAFTQLGLALGHSRHTGAGFTYYHADMAIGASAASRVTTTEDDILTALNERRLTLAYQPIIHASTRQTHHYECLLRLQKDDGALVSAGAFIMAAEDLELVHLLDRRALEIARETLLSHPNIHLALNVSAATVQNDDYAKDYLGALKALGAMTERITLELTETVALDDPAKATDFSAQARGMGCQFAIDDFGSGHTSFQNLMAIEADAIKIDGTFIQDLTVTPYKQTFVRMMVDLAQTFGVSTVAEMVERQDDAELLKRLGVDYLQGYMFGVPSPMPVIQRQAS